MGGGRCIYDGGVGELHSARPRAARSPLQLQESHVVGGSRAQEAGRDKKRHLGTSNWPIASQVEAVNPDLALKRHKITQTDLFIALEAVL